MSEMLTIPTERTTRPKASLKREMMIEILRRVQDNPSSIEIIATLISQDWYPTMNVDADGNATLSVIPPLMIQA